MKLDVHIYTAKFIKIENGKLYIECTDLQMKKHLFDYMLPAGLNIINVFER
jgi:hypothetical protein